MKSGLIGPRETYTTLSLSLEQSLKRPRIVVKYDEHEGWARHVGNEDLEGRVDRLSEMLACRSRSIRGYAVEEFQ